jgi:hypothetical protein
MWFFASRASQTRQTRARQRCFCQPPPVQDGHAAPTGRLPHRRKRRTPPRHRLEPHVARCHFFGARKSATGAMHPRCFFRPKTAPAQSHRGVNRCSSRQKKPASGRGVWAGFGQSPPCPKTAPKQAHTSQATTTNAPNHRRLELVRKSLAFIGKTLLWQKCNR